MLMMLRRRASHAEAQTGKQSCSTTQPVGTFEQQFPLWLWAVHATHERASHHEHSEYQHG